MLKIAAVLMFTLLAPDAQSQFQDVPLNLGRDGSVIQNGVRFVFGAPPKKVRLIGVETLVSPQDGPDGELDYPGLEYCARSVVLGLTALSVKARERGGDSVIDVKIQPQGSKPGFAGCDRGRVVITGMIVATP